MKKLTVFCACAALLAGCGFSAEDSADASFADSAAEIVASETSAADGVSDDVESLGAKVVTSEPADDGVRLAAKDGTSLPADGEDGSAENESGAEADGWENSAAELNKAVIDGLNGDAEEEVGLLESADDLQMYDVDGGNSTFAFLYDGEMYTAVYTPDNWKIVDSYKINSKADMVIICQALIDIHPIHGSEMENFRTAEDMAYEWIQHNIAYKILPEENRWKANAKDVDLNPADQNKTIYEMYREKAGTV